MINQKQLRKGKEERKKKQKKGRGRRKTKECMVVVVVSALVVGLVVIESQSIKVQNRRSRDTMKRKTLNSIEEVESIDL